MNSMSRLTGPLQDLNTAEWIVKVSNKQTKKLTNIYFRSGDKVLLIINDVRGKSYTKEDCRPPPVQKAEQL